MTESDVTSLLTHTFILVLHVVKQYWYGVGSLVVDTTKLMFLCTKQFNKCAQACHSHMLIRFMLQNLWINACLNLNGIQCSMSSCSHLY